MKRARNEKFHVSKVMLGRSSPQWKEMGSDPDFLFKPLLIFKEGLGVVALDF